MFSVSKWLRGFSKAGEQRKILNNKLGDLVNIEMIDINNRLNENEDYIVLDLEEDIFNKIFNKLPADMNNVGNKRFTFKLIGDFCASRNINLQRTWRDNIIFSKSENFFLITTEE